MIDSHCHLADDAFADDVEEVIARAREAGLTHALCVLAAGNAVEAERAERLTTLWPTLRTSIGVHPHQAGSFAERESEAAEVVRRAISGSPATRAIGEIGLDYHYDFAPREVQQKVFREQVKLARDLAFPIIVHTREAETDTLAILKEEAREGLHGVLHCFTGTRSLAEQGLLLGLHVSFAGIVTFPRASELREIVALIPDDRLLCETDCPYLAPVPHRGKRNEPAWVVRVAETLAEIRGASFSGLRDRITSNFLALFGP